LTGENLEKPTTHLTNASWKMQPETALLSSEVKAKWISWELSPMSESTNEELVTEPSAPAGGRHRSDKDR
jgi:hypothetical protein